MAEKKEDKTNTTRNDVSWINLMPYLSIRLFNLPEKSWEQSSVDLIKQFSNSLIEIINKYPLNAKGKVGAAKPQGITQIGSTVFPTNVTRLHTIPIDSVTLNELTDNHISLTAIWFRTSSTPPWFKLAPDGTNVIRDIKHHLVIFVVQPPYAGFLSTHEAIHSLVCSFLEDGQFESLKLPAPLSPVKEIYIENAFVNGETFHLWLKGNHRSIETKPDKKTIEGRDLRYAIDPFADQSYNYSAVVSRFNPGKILNTPIIMDDKGKTLSRVGYSRNTRAIWLTKTKGVLEFGQTFNLIRKMVLKAEKLTEQERNEIQKDRKGFTFLTESISAYSIKDAKQPFEISLNLMDSLPGGFNTDEQAINEEQWNANGFLEIIKDDKINNTEDYISIHVKAYFSDVAIGTFIIEIKRGIENDITIAVKEWFSLATDEETTEAFDLLDNLINQKSAEDAFNIRFETGHVLTGKNLYKQQYTDILFDQWKPVTLKKAKLNDLTRDYNASMEKPEKWNSFPNKRKLCIEIEKGTSLFSRVANDVAKLIQPTTGQDWHLLCHDKANEVADYIYIEPRNRRIELIHVKGANNNENREISIDAYQIVCTQAIKNLRHMNISELQARFNSQDDIRDAGQFLVSSDNPKKVNYDCTAFVEALNEMAKGLPVLHKKVVVFQPHITSSYWQDKVLQIYNRSADHSGDTTLRKAFMLSTLLIETEIACKKQGVKFEVWSEDTISGKGNSTAKVKRKQ